MEKTTKLMFQLRIWSFIDSRVKHFFFGEAKNKHVVVIVYKTACF